MRLVGWCCVLGLAVGAPHIVYLLADDFGWADVGYHRAPNDTDVQTPVLDGLARGGIELDRLYTHKICSPSRCSIQTGRAPIHVNVQNVPPEVYNSKDTEGGYQGIPRSMTGIASVLRRADYATHAVGKWDVGMATAEHHPRARGYQSWLGYWHHANDYWQHTEGKCSLKAVGDLWEYNSTYDAPAQADANGPDCSQAKQAPAGQKCEFEEQVLMDRAVSVITQHNQSVPLFLFYAMHLVHMPLQVPQRYLDKFASIDNQYRQLNHAMGNMMDEMVGQVVTALHTQGMWDNTLLVFHSDNGGEILGGGLCGGNNYPLTGGKFSNWEGGIRINGFVSGGVVPTQMQGSKLAGLATSWDWYSTFAGLAGQDPTDTAAAAAGLPPIDSIDLWPYLSGEASSSPRRSITIGDTSAETPNGDGDTLVGGLIQGEMKLLLGAADKLHTINQYVLTGPSWPNKTSGLDPLLHPKTCGRTPANGCLFNITADPTERTNLAAERPDVFQAMLDTVDKSQASVYSPTRGHKDPAACEAVKSKYNGYWGPFLS